MGSPPTLRVVHSALRGLEVEIANGEEILATLPLRKAPFSANETMLEEILTTWRTADLDDTGRPTTLQLRHWRSHLVMPHPEACAICERQFPMRAKVARGDFAARPTTGSVQVRRIARGGGPATATTPTPSRRSKLSAEELGF